MVCCIYHFDFQVNLQNYKYTTNSSIYLRVNLCTSMKLCWKSAVNIFVRMYNNTVQAKIFKQTFKDSKISSYFEDKKIINNNYLITNKNKILLLGKEAFFELIFLLKISNYTYSTYCIIMYVHMYISSYSL